jgi:hypothetical protein
MTGAGRSLAPLSDNLGLHEWSEGSHDAVRDGATSGSSGEEKGSFHFFDGVLCCIKVSNLDEVQFICFSLLFVLLMSYLKNYCLM